MCSASWSGCCCQVCKVYIGSFNADKPIRTDMNPSGEDLFNKEQADLLQDLFEIPQRSCDRKVKLHVFGTSDWVSQGIVDVPTAVHGVLQHFMLSRGFYSISCCPRGLTAFHAGQACDVDACCALVRCAVMVLYSLHCVSTVCRVIAVLITGEQV